MRISGLRSGQTKIPEVPDQTEFLEKWYEFHRGHRIVRKDDGIEERVAVLGEDFREVSPGCLPRTLDEMRAGRREAVETQQAQLETTEEQEPTGPSLEDTLEQMFVAASSEEEAQQSRPLQATSTPTQAVPPQSEEVAHSNNVHAQAMNPAASRNREYQMRRVAALRRELNRMRNGIERVISGLRDLGEDVPNYTETTGRLTALGQTLDNMSDSPSREEAEQAIQGVSAVTESAGASSQTDRTLANMQARVDDARARMDEASRSRDQAASEFNLAEQEFRTSRHRFQQLQREQRTTENYMRIFGTREEMLAQGENYESPIGGMFTRAYERFSAAEEIRREQRTLRQVLQDELRTEGEEVQRLEELERRQRDVWGVPQPQTNSTNVNTTQPGTELALDVTATAIDSVITGDMQSGSHDNQLESRSGRETPSVLVPTGEETMLEEHYAMLRRQDRSSQARTANDSNDTGTSHEIAISDPDTGNRPNDNFPRSMLNAIIAAREREVVERTSETDQDAPMDEALVENQTAPLQELNDELPQVMSIEDWWHEDAEIVIRALTSNDELREEMGMTPQEAASLLSYFLEDVISESDRTRIDEFLRNRTVIWSTNLPTEWVRRRKEQSPSAFFFTGDGGVTGSEDWAGHHNPYMRLEVLAQAYQMSSGVRSFAHSLTPPQRLQMLYRLQAGHRRDEDLEVLQGMNSTDYIFGFAQGLWRQNLQLDSSDDLGNAESRTADEVRQAMARDGDHSRQALYTRRRDTTHAFALAAGRQAMQTGSRALMERMAAGDEGTQAAYRRLEANFRSGPPRPTLYRQLTLSDYVDETSDTDTASDSEKEEEANARGLDARDSGRPEPKADEDLNVQMECKICYTQLSEIACLPCGHLVMCRWCSEQHSPSMQHDQTRPRRAAACPVCRKGIRQKVRVYRA